MGGAALAEAKRVFIELDDDDSGSLDRLELAELLRRLRAAATDGVNVDELFRIIDTDGSGNISFMEFMKWYKGYRAAPPTHICLPRLHFDCESHWRISPVRFSCIITQPKDTKNIIVVDLL